MNIKEECDKTAPRYFLMHDGWTIGLDWISIIGIYTGVLKYQDTVTVTNQPGTNDFAIEMQVRNRWQIV